jgi:hypothetical protein
MKSLPFIPREAAQPVADIAATVALLRIVSRDAARLRSIADAAPGGALAEHHRAREAETYVAEITGRIAARATSAGIEINDLIRHAEALIDDRARLPEGVQAMEEA